ncbi:LptA/OstA family protein [Aliikangiella sp. G2MR2-5]|uniref:LptA/OstA family protein n=1 Tax=Aliikangiella sp. G2MR2-5 TaxID=2788943 RepID=UPI0018AC3A2D|nr:LptA/OstA family protein [Aliikangiella sp. G2MR2-5]
MNNKNATKLYRKLFLAFPLSVVFFLSSTANAVTSSEIGNNKITSDSSKFDLNSNRVYYMGNALFTNNLFSISGEKIIAQKNSAQDTSQIEVEGNFAQVLRKKGVDGNQLNFSAKRIKYEMLNKKMLGEELVSLEINTIEGNHFQLQGERLEMLEIPTGDLNLKGRPLTLTISPGDGQKLTATAEILNYTQKQQVFELVGNVQLKTSRETIKADRLFYDAKNKLIDIPRSQKQQEMVQRVKSNNN